jgi:hypothetical protein
MKNTCVATGFGCTCRGACSRPCVGREHLEGVGWLAPSYSLARLKESCRGPLPPVEVVGSQFPRLPGDQALCRSARPPRLISFLFSLQSSDSVRDIDLSPLGLSSHLLRMVALRPQLLPPLLVGREITLSGGSLGSCVDEERSQLRELM